MSIGADVDLLINALIDDQQALAGVTGAPSVLCAKALAEMFHESFNKMFFRFPTYLLLVGLGSTIFFTNPMVE